ncbi:hypothetical protein HG530_003381 [Fusarium avenaceum]|nr:hypothetical protein HG530_003381 [Fusarium avenaceum]
MLAAAYQSKSTGCGGIAGEFCQGFLDPPVMGSMVMARSDGRGICVIVPSRRISPQLRTAQCFETRYDIVPWVLGELLLGTVVRKNDKLNENIALVSESLNGGQDVAPTGPCLGSHANNGHAARARAECNQTHTIALAKGIDHELEGIPNQVDLNTLHGRGNRHNYDHVDRYMDRLSHGWASGKVGVLSGRGCSGPRTAPGGGGRRYSLWARTLPLKLLIGFRLAAIVLGAANRRRLDGVKVEKCLLPQLELVSVLETKVKLRQLGDREAESQDVFVDVARLRHFIQMLFNKN